jgi:hypothetical protein
MNIYGTNKTHLFSAKDEAAMPTASHCCLALLSVATEDDFGRV